MATRSKGVFGWFNRALDSEHGRAMRGVVGWSLRRTGRLMVIYVVLLVGAGLGLRAPAGGFLPIEDQGFFTVDMQTPPDASFNRTPRRRSKQVERYLAQRPASRT